MGRNQYSLLRQKLDPTEYFHRQDCLLHISERHSACHRPAAMAAFSICRADGLKTLLCWFKVTSLELATSFGKWSRILGVQAVNQLDIG